MSHSNRKEVDETIKECHVLIKHIDNSLRDIDETVKILIDLTRCLYEMKHNLSNAIEKGE